MKAEKTYLLVENGKETGPFTEAVIAERIATGEIYSETICIPQSLFQIPATLDKFFQNTISKPTSPLEVTNQENELGPTSPTKPAVKETNFLSHRNIGIGLVVLSVCAFLIGFNLDTTVSSGGDRIHNIGLLSDKQNFILFAVAMAVVGAIFMNTAKGADSDTVEHQQVQRQTRNCPYCAETIKAEATLCRFCNKEVQPIDIRTS